MPGKSALTGPDRDAAQKNFDALKDLYRQNDTLPPEPGGRQVAFWKLGNSFDTMIDYLEFIDSSSAGDVAAMAVTQLNASLKHIDGGYNGAWFDDFGWWSVASQRALQKSFFDATAKEQLQTVLKNCWSRFTGNAPFVWERRQPGSFKDYGPAVDGGVWNAYWTGTADQYPGPKNGDPSSGSLVGIQNTVTNALYLMAAQRLGVSDPAAKQAAARELNFLLTWLDEKSTPLWWTLGDDAGLARERVGHFANVTPALGFQEKWAWTGDQGLMLGALSDAALAAAPGSGGPLLARAKHIVAGVQQNLVDSTGVVLSFTPPNYNANPPIVVPDGDTSDYQVGSGVFWRNYLHVWTTNPDLQAFLATPVFEAMVRASATAAAKPLTGKESIETLTNQLAVLVGACV